MRWMYHGVSLEGGEVVFDYKEIQYVGSQLDESAV